mmetsp:Transcript_48357/g.135094  ORF Transcript_48357/g.135094 Transcript_48357/m.135094 type:complete len:96 (+) Transcript_48357:194-481(+)
MAPRVSNLEYSQTQTLQVSQVHCVQDATSLLSPKRSLITLGLGSNYGTTEKRYLSHGYEPSSSPDQRFFSGTVTPTSYSGAVLTELSCSPGALCV